ncbi:MAG: Hsp70 family protein [Cyanobacterium sp. T60_A2020_053]|nr:Hsp70 family protein [Cyanobacterium sp. T60_A2020_053]
MIIALDFGTSNTVIATFNPKTQQEELINLSKFSENITKNIDIIPTLVYVENAKNKDILLGRQAKERELKSGESQRFFSNFKRGIGVNIQGFLPELDGEKISFETVGEWYLSSLIEALPEKPKSLIITVPVDSFESYRHWLTTVCQKWAVEQVKIIDEPTAAALGYGLDQDRLVLVVDFGGGTLDFSLVELDLGKSGTAQGFILKWGEKILGENSKQKPKVAKVIAKAGISLGGADLDNWIVDYFVREKGLEKSLYLTRLAEQIKIRLSRQKKVQESYQEEEKEAKDRLSLSINEFEQILEQNNFFTRLDDLMADILQQGKNNGIIQDNIDLILLVGGGSQIPALQNWLQQYFPPEKIKSERPYSAIATGALKLEQGMQVKDFLYHSYGIRYWNRRQNCHSWHTIISSGQPYPMKNPIELVLGASMVNQPSIELLIGEMGAENITTEVYFDGDRLVTKQVSSGTNEVQILNSDKQTIANLNPLGMPGNDRVKVLFKVDESCQLRITVEDLLTNEILIDNSIVAQLS